MEPLKQINSEVNVVIAPNSGGEDVKFEDHPIGEASLSQKTYKSCN